tara:strand:- start:1416 stop:1631 length:216 start_codon:yes stop_codon:yes gene_type:complete
MDKLLYRSLLMLVNDKDQMERLEEYVAERIRHHRDNLEKQKDINRILEAQGAIVELKRFKTLRDEVIKGAE